MNTYERIKELCEKNGFSISSIGDKIPGLSINKASVTGWKNGSVPRPDKIKAIADYFGVSYEYLRCKTNDPSSAEKSAVTDDDLKVALFGGDKEVTDEMWREVLNFAEYVKNRKKNENDKH